MDLRHRQLTPAQLDEIHCFIQQRKLAYQPFEFTETLQVGEGQKFRDGEFADRCGNVLWEGHPPNVAELITKDSAAFQTANRELRRIYDWIVEFIVKNVDDDVANLTFAEFGCNTGYFMHSLAARGAKKTTGYDFTENSAVFRLFNEVLGIPPARNEFRFAEWDSLNHRVQHTTFDDADVCLSVAVTCHLADPLHHLAFLCSKARKAVFFWCPASREDGLSISFGKPAKYPNSLAFPIDFDNDVRLSPALLRLTMERCGFANIVEIETPEVSPGFNRWFKSQKGFLALRTSSPATVYTNGCTRRIVPADAPLAVAPPDSLDLPADLIATVFEGGPATPKEPQLPVLVEEGYRAFNIVRFQERYIALAQDLGPVNVAEIDEASLLAICDARKACVGTSVDDARRQIDHLTIDALLDSVRQLEERLNAPQGIARFFNGRSDITSKKRERASRAGACH